MPAASEVTPKDWTEILVVYDDGVYSAIWGRFRRRPFKQIGVRWNEGDTPGGVGYPNLFQHPVWYVEPPFLSSSLLQGLFARLLTFSASPRQAELLRNIAIAMQQEQNQPRDEPTAALPSETERTIPQPVTEALPNRSDGSASPTVGVSRPHADEQAGEQETRTWAGHWFFNTNESYSPGAYQKMFPQGVAAIYGYESGSKKLQGSCADDHIFAYVNQQGLRAVGVIVDGKVVAGKGVFLDEDGQQQPGEFHLKVRWEAIVAPSRAISAAQAVGLGHPLPVRSTFARLYNGQKAQLLEGELRERAQNRV